MHALRFRNVQTRDVEKKRGGWVKDTPVFSLLPPFLPNPFLQTSSSNRFSTPSPTPFFITLSQPLLFLAQFRLGVENLMGAYIH